MQTTIINKLSGLINRAPMDVVGIDCASNGVRLVRMKKGAAGLSLVGAQTVDPVESVLSPAGGPDSDSGRLSSIPVRVRGRYAALAVPGTHGVVKMLRVAEQFDSGDKNQMMAKLGCDESENYRFAVRTIMPATGRSEARLLAAALPEWQAQALLDLLPSSGLPAPRSIEVSELAVVNAFMRFRRIAGDGEADGLIHFDHDVSVFALFNGGVLSQLRAFKFGVTSVLQKVIDTLNVDEQTAEGVLMDGAFDISHLVEEGAREIGNQFLISRDYMERSENCRLKKLYVSGPPSLVSTFMRSMPHSSEVAEWNAFDGIDTHGDVSEEIEAAPWRVASAIGACVGVLEDE